MDCSNDSFVWTDDFSDSSDSNKTLIMQQDELDESGLDYKKKIQEELFNNQPTPTKTKRKRTKASEMLDSSPVCNDKSIKKESDSDIEALKKKKKRKNTESEERLYLSLAAIQADNYLNLRVKQEQLLAEPGSVKMKKKHKKDKQLEFESQDSESTEILIFGNGSDINNVDDMLLNNDEKTIVEIDKFEAEETIVQKKKKEKKQKSKNNTSDGKQTLHNNLQEHISNKNSRKEKKRSLDTPITTNGVVDTDSCFEPPPIHIKPAPEIKSLNEEKNKKSETESHKKKVKILSNKKSRKITDRLIFEDEESVDSEILSDTSSKQLQQFINMKTNLKVCTSKIQKENIITDEDEVWIFRIPKEVDVNDLQDVNFTMNTKWKIKINGQSYDGVVENQLSQIPLLCYDQSKCQIKNMTLMGEVNLRKRIPKAHIPQETCMINNQTNFIPLPETKCRHPLFGIDYKKAIKIPKPIAERLKGNNEEDISLESFSGKKEKKKKHKKEKKKIENESEPEIDIEVLQSPNPKKKKGKKKHREMMQDSNTTKSIKFKSTDLEPDSAEVWESEQAIEANLFNF